MFSAISPAAWTNSTFAGMNDFGWKADLSYSSPSIDGEGDQPQAGGGEWGTICVLPLPHRFPRRSPSPRCAQGGFSVRHWRADVRLVGTAGGERGCAWGPR